MKTKLFKIFLLTAFIPLLGTAHNGGKLNGKYTKEKTIEKSFDVNNTALLKVRNSYGNLTLNSWDKDEISIVVNIKTNGNNEEKVIERLEEIDVDFTNTKELVEAITRFQKEDNGWGWNWGKRNNVSVQVNYTINLPVKASINLSNDYGNIFLDRVDGHAKISCDYGKMEIGELRGRNNELRFDYTSKSSFDYINSAEISADYSGFRVDKAGSLRIKADYTNTEIMQAEKVEFKNDYGSIDINTVGEVSGVGSYIGIKLGEVSGSVDLDSDYGSIKIGRMLPSAGNLSVRSDYTGVKIGVDPAYAFDLEVETDYAGVRGLELFDLNISREDGSDRYYEGFHSKANSGRTVSVRSDYGGVSFSHSE